MYDYLQSLMEFNGELIFVHHASTDSVELYQSDGTRAGTVPLFDDPSFVVSGPTVVGGSLFFQTRQTQGGDSFALWAIKGAGAAQQIDEFPASSSHVILGGATESSTLR